MIVVSASPLLHYVGDGAAWCAAALGGRWVYRFRRSSVDRLARVTEPGYFVALAIGGGLGAWVLGSLNSMRSSTPALSHSVAGALAGAILAVELWKWRRGIRASTGGPFVIPLCLGLIVGRWGCLFAGLPDGTYGIATTLPWAVDLGDGIPRHPVTIYESLAMAGFLLAYWPALVAERPWAVRHGFHAFVLAYALQRFAWEWLKPYPAVLGPLNLFHFLSLGLAAYALVWIGRGRHDLVSATQAGAVPVPRPDNQLVRDLPGVGSGQGGDRG